MLLIDDSMRVRSAAFVQEFFRNVMNFGAVGDGVADDTAAIKYIHIYIRRPSRGD